MKKRKRVPKWRADPTAFQRAIHRVTPYTADEIKSVDLRGRLAYEKLRSGAGTENDYDELVHTLNTNAQRLREMGEDDVHEVCGIAAAAMMRCRERYMQQGKFGFDGPGMAAIHCALDLHTQVLALSTEGEMMEAQMKQYVRLI